MSERSKKQVISNPLRAEQVRTHIVSIHRIMADPLFARGLNEVRSGQPFDSFISIGINAAWNYERGRLFGHVAPSEMPLYLGRGYLNPKALALFHAASHRGLIP